MREWQDRLATPSAGAQTILAIRPILREWVENRKKYLTFRLVQILSGHGCFGKYLCDVARRETSTRCHECGDPEDSALHTLQACPMWEQPRQYLIKTLGADLSLPAVVKAMVQNEQTWHETVAFCEHVMSQKEAAEKIREKEALSGSIRCRRVGRRRRDNANLQPP